MLNNHWKMFATSLAMYARQQLATTPRGSLMIRMVEEGRVVAGVFGNSNFIGDTRARLEAVMIRQRSQEAGLEPLEFGVSLDGYTWALLIRLDDGQYQTEAGRALHRELQKITLDDIVQEVGQTVYGTAPALSSSPVPACP
jgi:hypothetical protein